MTLREVAEQATNPCSLCDLTVPHAFEEPNAHTWDPNHVTVNPTALIEVLDAAAEVVRLIDAGSVSFEDESMRRSLAMVRQLRIAIQL